MGSRVDSSRSRREMTEIGSGVAALSAIVACCPTRLQSPRCESFTAFVYAVLITKRWLPVPHNRRLFDSP